MASELERLCEILAKLDADLTEVAAGLVGCAQHMDRGLYKVQSAHNMDPLSGQTLTDAGLAFQAAQATCTEAAVLLDATSKAGQGYINYLLGSGRQFGTSGPAVSSPPAGGAGGSSGNDGESDGGGAPPDKPPAPSDIEPTDRADIARHTDNQPTMGDSDGSIGQWTEIKRSDLGLADQEWGTGVDRLPNGQTIEYVVPSGKDTVEFDGHLFRGDPPVEVFQEVKGNYDFIYKPFPPGESIEDKTYKVITTWVKQAQRQSDAIKSTGADLEWVLTRNPELVEPLQDALTRRGLFIDVRYVPGRHDRVEG